MPDSGENDDGKGKQLSAAELAIIEMLKRQNISAQPVSAQQGDSSQQHPFWDSQVISPYHDSVYFIQCLAQCVLISSYIPCLFISQCRMAHGMSIKKDPFNQTNQWKTCVRSRTQCQQVSNGATSMSRTMQNV